MEIGIGMKGDSVGGARRKGKREETRKVGRETEANKGGQRKGKVGRKGKR